MPCNFVSRCLGCAALLTALLYRPAWLPAEPASAPATAPAATDEADADSSADNYRTHADALWSVKHDYPKALETYHKGRDRFPDNVRILVSLASTSIDFGYQHSKSDAGRAAYKEARAAIDKGLRLIADGTGTDIDDEAKDKLDAMKRQIP